MTLTFLGTRGNIDVRSRRHRRHTTTLVSNRGLDVMIDCGADWLRTINRVRPGAIVVTHAHSDHVDGLKNGAPCAVYAPAAVWNRIERWPIRDPRLVRCRAPVMIRGIVFEAFRVHHSINVPAVGYRITTGRTTVFYVPDVLDIPNRREALAKIALFIGDGATLSRPIVRHQDKVLIGHASIATQLDWCAISRVPRAIFTHCGTAIVNGGTVAEKRVEELGRVRGVDTEVACDGVRITIE